MFVGTLLREGFGTQLDVRTVEFELVNYSTGQDFETWAVPPSDPLGHWTIQINAALWDRLVSGAQLAMLVYGLTYVVQELATPWNPTGESNDQRREREQKSRGSSQLSRRLRRLPFRGLDPLHPRFTLSQLAERAACEVLALTDLLDTDENCWPG